jgi:hypothetical protein
MQKIGGYGEKNLGSLDIAGIMLPALKEKGIIIDKFAVSVIINTFFVVLTHEIVTNRNFIVIRGFGKIFGRRKKSYIYRRAQSATPEHPKGRLFQYPEKIRLKFKMSYKFYKSQPGVTQELPG